MRRQRAVYPGVRQRLIVSAALALLLFAVALLAQAGFLYFQERRAAAWPRTSATLVEVRPQSTLERSGRSWILNLDSDHVIEWVVDGRTYRAPQADAAHATLVGFKVWRKPPVGGSRELFYNPALPSEHLLEESMGAWKYAALLGLACALAGVVAGAV